MAQPPAVTQAVVDLRGQWHYATTFVAWSPTEGFNRILSDSWVEEDLVPKESIVAKPKHASLMLEAVLCRILSLALSPAGGPE